MKWEIVEREREVSLSLIVCASALLLINGGCQTGRQASLGLEPDQLHGQDTSTRHDMAVGGQDGSGAPDGGSNGFIENGETKLTGPPVKQSLFDYSQTGIAAWGPVIATHEVSHNGQIYEVQELEDGDPFLGLYQLPNGDLVFTNQPFDQIVAAVDGEEPLPPSEVWNSPEGPVEIFSGQIMALFKPEVTQLEIEQFIQLHNLHVIFSWFEAPENPEAGNAIASFQFRYDPGEFSSFDEAYSFFSSDPLIDATMPNRVHGVQLDYVGGPPNDSYYAGLNPRCQHVNALGVDTNPFLTYGPPYGGALSTTAVAVLDLGVDRQTEDFGILPSNIYKKVSWAGITSSEYYEKVVVGKGAGNVVVPDPYRPPARHPHGTQVAGTITAATHSNTRGVAGLAPQIGALPVRLTKTGDSTPGISSACVQNALVALRKVFDNGMWIEDIRVTNSSFSVPGARSSAIWRFFEKWYGRDAYRCDRLHVASAGNDSMYSINVPAALDVVLGVSGLVCTEYGGTWFPYVTETPNVPQGSNYWIDHTAPDPNSRYYPVSGIYGFTNANHSAWRELGYTTASVQYLLDPDTHYLDFNGTSFASPQVAGLAALLRMRRPSATYSEVAARIVGTRNIAIENTMENTYGIPLAGLVNYYAALQGW